MTAPALLRPALDLGEARHRQACLVGEAQGPRRRVSPAAARPAPQIGRHRNLLLQALGEGLLARRPARRLARSPSTHTPRPGRFRPGRERSSRPVQGRSGSAPQARALARDDTQSAPILASLRASRRPWFARSPPMSRSVDHVRQTLASAGAAALPCSLGRRSCCGLLGAHLRRVSSARHPARLDAGRHDHLLGVLAATRCRRAKPACWIGLAVLFLRSVQPTRSSSRKPARSSTSSRRPRRTPPAWPW